MSRGKSRDSRNGAGVPPVRPGGRIEIAPRVEIDIATDHLGAVLSDRRNVLGLKIEDVAEDIKIRPEYLRALEDEALDTLPTPEYGRLFLKSYAERLGIDVSEAYALLDLCERPLKTKPPPEAPPETGTPQPQTARRPFPLIGVAAAVVIVVAVALWVVLRGGGDAADDETVGETQDEPPPPVAEVVAEPQERPVPQIGDGPMQLELTFDRETWVVLAADSDTVVNRLLYSGDAVQATAVGFFNLTLGHTDGVVASVDGQRLIPFRERASRLSGITITADSARAWRDTSTAEVIPEEALPENDSATAGP